ncbi:MAG: AraC family transcriptional regulator [Verrucomicrobiota bacterium]
MSHTLNAVDALGAPFLVVDEQVFTIPEGGSNEVVNRFFKVICLLQGACWHEIIGGERIQFEAGDVLVIPFECRQLYWPLHPRGSRRIHALRLVFDPQILPPLDANPTSAAANDSTVDFISFIRQRLGEYQHLRLARNSAFQTLLAQIRREAEQRLPGHRFRVTALCTELIVTLARQLGEHHADRPAPSRRRTHLVEQAQEYLVKNLDRDITLARVAASLRISEEHLARSFKQQTGQTVFGFLQNIRIEKAKTYLLGSDRTITDIARHTGFSSVFLFSRAFKRVVGISPLAYRQQRWTESTVNFSVLKTTAPAVSRSIVPGRRAPKND